VQKLKNDSRGSTYSVVLFFIAFFFFAFIWYIFFSSDGVIAVTREAMSSFVETSGASNHPVYDPITTFIAGIQTYILIVGIIGMFIAGVVYTQKRRAEGY